MYTETLEKELGSIKWKDFYELPANKTENIIAETDTFINTVGKVLRKTRKPKESEVKNRKIRNKK